MVSPQARREQVELACQRGLSERRACGLLDVARSTLSYNLRLPAKDAPVIEAMKTLSAQYPRYGYRRIRIFLRRQGFELSWSRTHQGRPAAAQEAAAPAHRHGQAAAVHPLQSQHGVGQ